MSDVKKISTSIKKIRSEKKDIEVFRVGLSGNKIIDFPDFYEMDSEAGDAIIQMVSQRMPQGQWALIQLWLETDDVAKLKEEKLSTRELAELIGKAIEHYEKHYGASGE